MDFPTNSFYVKYDLCESAFDSKEQFCLKRIHLEPIISVNGLEYELICTVP